LEKITNHSGHVLKLPNEGKTEKYSNIFTFLGIISRGVQKKYQSLENQT